MPDQEDTGSIIRPSGFFAGAIDFLTARPWRVFVSSLAALFAIMAAWSLATPLFASPDEPAHVVRAVSLVRGDLLGRTGKGATNPVVSVEAPEVYAVGSVYAERYVLKGTIPASCNRPLTRSEKEIPVTTYVGRYPPLYYAIVGLPSLVTVSSSGLYLMRIMSGLLGSVYLALAVMAVVVWSRNRLMLLGLIVAITPMTYFLGSVVNPNGLEITAATCLWCSGLLLVLEHSSRPPPGLVAVVVASATGLMLMRGLSVLWVVLIVLTLAVLGGWRAMVDIAASRAARWSMVVFVPAAIFAVIWIAVAHALDVVPNGYPVGSTMDRVHIVAEIMGFTSSWLQQMVGVFGWLDTSAPLLTYLIWYALTRPRRVARPGVLHVRRELATLLLLGMMVFLVPPVLIYSQVHSIGIDWQGRYTLPLAVGIPLLSVAILDRSQLLRRVQPRLAIVLCLAVGLGQIAAFAQALRRYAVGSAGPLDYFNGWQPPLGSWVITLWAVLAMCLFMALIYGFVRNTRVDVQGGHFAEGVGTSTAASSSPAPASPAIPSRRRRPTRRRAAHAQQ